MGKTASSLLKYISYIYHQNGIVKYTPPPPPITSKKFFVLCPFIESETVLKTFNIDSKMKSESFIVWIFVEFEKLTLLLFCKQRKDKTRNTNETIPRNEAQCSSWFFLN